MKNFNYHYLDITKWEPDFQIDEVLEISERLTYYKDDFSGGLARWKPKNCQRKTI